jgi:hypothetical protein
MLLTYVTTCMLDWDEVLWCLLCLENPSFNRITLLLKIYWNLILDSKHVCFWYSLIRWYWVMKCLWPVYACMLIVCFYFSGDRFERRVCGGGRGLWISRRRRPGTRWPRQAIYLLHTWTLIFHLALFLLLFFLLCIVFQYCYDSLYSNSWRLSSTSRLDIIHRDDTLDAYTTPLY